MRERERERTRKFDLSQAVYDRIVFKGSFLPHFLIFFQNRMIAELVSIVGIFERWWWGGRVFSRPFWKVPSEEKL